MRFQPMTPRVARQLVERDVKHALRGVLWPLAPIAWGAGCLAAYGLAHSSAASLSAAAALAGLTAGVAMLSTGVLLARHVVRGLRLAMASSDR
jgi:hypothetical protein